MSLYKQFKTNMMKEQEGVRVEYGPNEDGSIPTFFLRRMHKSNRAYSKALEVATRPHRRAIELETLDSKLAERIFLDVFVSTILCGWDNVYNEEGQPLPFSKENAVNLLESLPELYDDLQEKARKVSLFMADNLEEDGKN